MDNPRHTPPSPISALIRLVRPKQWVKNAFVFGPLLFSGEFTEPKAAAWSLFAFLLFCMASSIGYIVNDLCDVDADRRHPAKSRARPLASGALRRKQAFGILGVLSVVFLGFAVLVPDLLFVLLGYLAVTLSYSFFLKHQPVLDIFAIAIGFVLRVYAGAVAIDVPLSAWMFITTLCLALFLASVKRRQELVDSGEGTRTVLRLYSDSLLNRYAEMSATGALVFYSLYVVTTAPGLVMTVPMVLFALFRYWYIVQTDGKGESPTDSLLSDWQMLVIIASWAGVCAWALLP